MSLSTSITIDASAADVWRILAALHDYRDWNPYYRSAEGVVAEGEVITLHAVLPGGQAATSRCRIVRVSPDSELRWTSRLKVPGLMDTEHCFRLVGNAAGQTVLEQHETLRGALVPVTGGVVNQIKKGCTAMGEALKKHAES
ncbi:SRPBCC domain-containing protein [Streptomyces sp. P5-A9]|uniref:SRPBCC domain-containing protein n=2 Tax=unclassified Streptomyces TaxID=2593676 RepID=UPI002FCA88BD